MVLSINEIIGFYNIIIDSARLLWYNFYIYKTHQQVLNLHQEGVQYDD